MGKRITGFVVAEKQFCGFSFFLLDNLNEFLQLLLRGQIPFAYRNLWR